MEVVERRPSEVLRSVRELRPWIAERAGEVERAGRLTAELTRRLLEAGCFRMGVPAEHEGDDLALDEVLAVVEALARADGSVGWAVGQVALSQVMLGYLPPAARAVIYADGPDVLAAGAAAPKGRAERTRTGWRVSGQWPLVSGCQQASWIFLQCVVVADRTIRIAPGGAPQTRMVVLPAEQVEIVDTWDAVGLRGTGSHDVLAQRVECSEDWSVELAAGAPEGAAILRVPPPTQGGLFVAATVAGLAGAALDAVTELAAAGKRSAFIPRRLAASPVFQVQLGDARLTLEAARSLLFEELERVEDLAGAGATIEPADRARLRAAGVKAIELAVRAVDFAYTLAGSSSLYARSSLQRSLRDAHAATQHFTASRELYGPHGALLAGVELDPAFV